jgi:hypothetical protein
VPGRKVDPAAIRQELTTTTDGIRAHDLIRDLLRAETTDSIPILVEYATSGPLDHVRWYASARLVDLVAEGDTAYAGFFEAGLSDAHLAYWSIQGLVRVSGKSSFPALTLFALNPAHRVEDRGKAIREMAILSGQHFIQGLPTDPGHWKGTDLPIKELEDWAAAGFPRGPGFALPERHARLDAPDSRLDQVASHLDAKLAKLRKANQDPVNPSNWLVPAMESDLAAIQSRWRLPYEYVQFLRDFSPLKVHIVSRRYFQGLDLYGAAELFAAQHGYSFNPLTGELDDSWPSAYVVIASHAGDPFVLDLSQDTADDAPVLTADHGQGTWDFSQEAPSFLKFLEILSR